MEKKNKQETLQMLNKRAYFWEILVLQVFVQEITLI